ncbi:N-acetyltransferase family protein [Nocardia brasiliensis]
MAWSDRCCLVGGAVVRASRQDFDVIRPRQVQVADAEGLVPLFADLGHAATASQLTSRLTRLTADPTYQAWVAPGSTGELLGFAAGHLIFPVEDDDPAAQLIALVTASSARRCGVGTALCRDFENWAIQHRARRAVVNSGQHRRGAHDFYEGIGWGQTGIRLGKSLSRSAAIAAED